VTQDLGTLGAPDAGAWFINDHGQITGIAHTEIIDPASGCPLFHLFFWQDGKMFDIGTLGGSYAQPNSMNERGEVVGGSLVAEDEAGHGFLWSHGHLTDLETLGGCCGVADWIIDNGAVGGKAEAIMPGDALSEIDPSWSPDGKSIMFGRSVAEAARSISAYEP
jgi:probable HAF family extracellular repeat protein